MRILNVFQSVFLIAIAELAIGAVVLACSAQADVVRPQLRMDLLPEIHRDLDEGWTYTGSTIGKLTPKRTPVLLGPDTPTPSLLGPAKPSYPDLGPCYPYCGVK